MKKKRSMMGTLGRIIIKSHTIRTGSQNSGYFAFIIALHGSHKTASKTNFL